MPKPKPDLADRSPLSAAARPARPLPAKQPPVRGADERVESDRRAYADTEPMAFLDTVPAADDAGR